MLLFIPYSDNRNKNVLPHFFLIIAKLIPLHKEAGFHIQFSEGEVIAVDKYIANELKLCPTRTITN